MIERTAEVKRLEGEVFDTKQHCGGRVGEVKAG